MSCEDIEPETLDEVCQMTRRTLDAWIRRAPGDLRDPRCLYRGVFMEERFGGWWHEHWHSEPCTVPMRWIGGENFVRRSMLLFHRAIAIRIRAWYRLAIEHPL